MIAQTKVEEVVKLKTKNMKAVIDRKSFTIRPSEIAAEYEFKKLKIVFNSWCHVLLHTV